MCYMTAVSIMK